MGLGSRFRVLGFGFSVLVLGVVAFRGLRFTVLA